MAKRVVEGEKVKPARRFEGCPTTETSAGIPIKPVYTPEDIKDIDYQQEVGNPGEYPFTRGIWGDMYRGKLWTRRVFTGLGSPCDTNKRYRFLISRGASGLYCFGDNFTHMGLDPDHPLTKGYAGIDGVSYCRLRDMYELFEGISLEGVSITFNNPSMAAAVAYTAFITYAEEQGYDLKKLSGSITNDPLHTVYPLYDINCCPLDMTMKVACDVIEYSVKHTPRWHPIVPNAYDLHERGANAIQEMGFALSITMAYIDRLLKRGLKIDEFAPRMNVLAFATDIDLFEEVAKYRALRRMWAKMMRERYGAKTPASCRLYLSSHTSGHSLTVAQPANNIIRLTLQSLACVLGGLQSFDPCGYEEGYYRLTEEGALTTLNIHNILGYEARVAATADPLAGSYYVEWLTSRMEEEAFKIIKEIEDRGGAVKATESGWIGEQLDKELIKERIEIEEKKRIIVGLNEFVVPKEQEVPIKLGRDAPLEEQIATAERREREIREFKQTRDNEKTRNALEFLRTEAKKGERHNIIPAIKDALKADATMGEILGVIRLAYGVSYDPLNVIQYPFD